LADQHFVEEDTVGPPVDTLTVRLIQNDLKAKRKKKKKTEINQKRNKKDGAEILLARERKRKTNPVTQTKGNEFAVHPP
jgi:hypothetical protein